MFVELAVDEALLCQPCSRTRTLRLEHHGALAESAPEEVTRRGWKGKWPHLGQELPTKRGSQLGRTTKGRKPQRCEDAQLTTGHRQNWRAVGQLSAQHQDKPVTSADLQGVYDPDSLNNLIPQCQLLSDCAKCHLATCLISLWKDYKAWLTCSLHLEKRGC